MPPQFAWEFYRFPATRELSIAACEAAAFVARDTPARETPALQLVLGTDAPPTMAYLAPPDRDEFWALEPYGVAFHDEQYFMFSVTTQ